MAQIIKRKDNYLIQVSCGYDTSGKQVTQSMTYIPEIGLSDRQIQKELTRQAVMFEDKCRGGQIVNSVKFQTFAEQWFKEYAEIQMKIKSVERYKMLQARTYAAIGHLRLDKITVRNLQSFINSLSADGINQNTGGKLAPKTIKHYLSFISSIFAYAVKMGVVTENPCHRVSLPPAENIEQECYTLEEAQHLLDLLQSAPTKYRAFFTLAMYGGFRRAELLGLEWKDIDFESGLVKIERTSLYTKELGQFTDTPKTKGSRRCLKLPPEVMFVLKQHQNEQLSQILKLGNQWQRLDRLFTAWNGEPMHGVTPYSWLKKFCERNNMRFLNVHSFRHLNASLLINNGVDVKTVSACLGHSNTTTTLTIYAHTFAEAKARAMDTVGNALNFHDTKQDKAQ
ncbi:MAG: site-specific integrase [Oscillospiraceae bacterium]